MTPAHPFTCWSFGRDSFRRNPTSNPSKTTSPVTPIPGIKMGKIWKRCGLEGCEFSTTAIRELDDHIYNQHQCACGFVGKSKVNHACPGVALVGAGNQQRQIQLPVLSETTFSLIRSAHNNSILEYKHVYLEDHIVIEESYQAVYSALTELVTSYQSTVQTLKVHIYYKLLVEDNESKITEERHFNSGALRISNRDVISHVLQIALTLIVNQYQILTVSQSGMTIKRVENIEVKMAHFKPNYGSSFLPLPMKGKKGILNPKNEDESCFAFSVLLHFYMHHICPTEKPFVNPGRRNITQPNAYRRLLEVNQREQRLNLAQFGGRVEDSDITLFEIINKASVNVYVYCKKEGTVIPLRQTTAKYDDHIHLFLIRRKDLDKSVKKKFTARSHYCLIHNAGAFLRNSSTHSRVLCKYCSNMFSPNSILKHQEYCLNSKTLNLQFPIQTHHEFLDFYKLLRPPYIGYVSLLPLADNDNNINIHGFAIIGINPANEIIYEQIYVGDDAIICFIEKLVECANILCKLQRENHLPLNATLEDEERKKAATHCQFGCLLTEENYPVLHHDHFRDNNIQIICRDHNLKIKAKPFVYFVINNKHNIALNAILLNIRKVWTGKLIVIPHKDGGILSIILPNKLRLICAERFLDEDNNFLLPHFNRMENATQYEPFLKHFGSAWLLNLQFPGTFISSANELKKCNSLPPQDAFYDLDKQKIISNDDYHATGKFYKEKNLNNLEQYGRIYLHHHVLAMFATFDSFSEWLAEKYGLYVYHDFTLAGFSWAVCFYKSRKKFEYVKDPRIIELIRSTVVGPISYLGTHDIIADKNHHILSCDSNSMYPHIMKQDIPISGYKLLTEDEVNSFDMTSLGRDKNKGHILNVSLKYEESIKAKTWIFPLVVERKGIGENDNDNVFIKDLASQAQFPLGENVAHNVQTQCDKENVTLHYESLLWFLEMGLVIKKINFIIEYQAAFLEEFINYNLNLKRNVPTKFEKRIFKRISNLIYGNFLSLRKNLNITFAPSAKKAQMLVSRSNFVDVTILDKDLTMFKMDKLKTLCNKNILIAFTILCRSKLHMFKAVYKLQDHFGMENFMLCSLETDGLVASVKCNNYLDKLGKLEDILDYSTLPKEHPLHNPILNADKDGFFKLENPYARRFIKLRSKCYAFMEGCVNCFLNETFCDDCTREATLKGASKQAITTFQNYEQALEGVIRLQGNVSAIKTNSSGSKLIEKQVPLLQIKLKDRAYVDGYQFTLPHGYVGPLPPGFR